MTPPTLRKALPWIGTHLLALAAGVWLFKPGAGASSTGKADAHPAAAAVAAADEQAAAPSRKAPPRPAHEASPASIHKLAWKALAYEGLDRPERLEASGLILKQWVKEDWQGALDTVMKETPDDYDLLVHFDEVFQREPAAVWSIIESKRYGVVTRSLKVRWMGSIGRLDEAARQEATASLPESVRKEIEDQFKGG